MGTKRFFRIKKTHFDFVLGFMNGFLCGIIVPVVDYLWVLLSKFTVYVFGSIMGFIFRFPGGNRCLEENDSRACLDSNFDGLKKRQSSDFVDHGYCGGEDSALVASTSKYEFLYRKSISRFVEEPKTENYTVRKFYMGANDYADFNGGIPDSRDSADGDVDEIEFKVEDVIDEEVDRKTESFIEEKAEDSTESFMIEKLLDEEEEPQVVETNDVFENKTEESALRFSFVFEKQIKQEQLVEAEVTVEEKTESCAGEKAEAIETEVAVKEQARDSVENFIVEKLLEKPKQGIEMEDTSEEKSEVAAENHFIEKNSEKRKREIEDKEHVEEKFEDFLESPVIDMYLEKWKREKDESNEDGEAFSPRSKVDVESITHEVLANMVDSRPESLLVTDGHETHERNTSITDHEAAIITSPITDSDDEFIELELRSEKLCVMGETESRERLTIEHEDDPEESIISPEKAMEPTMQEEEADLNYEDQDDSEHDDLIERLKTELKIARTGGLPTILEEFESPRMVPELGPLQIDEKYDHKHHIAEIQKVYRSYSDRMRKLDILNSQTMHAISLLQLKDPVRLSKVGKSSAPGVKSVLSQNVWPFKQRKPEADPAMKLIRDLQRDFETVYVGQVCLSWEILNWQYGKVEELLGCDSHGIRQYNQVAGEFQLFQVLMQRFLENEPFQGRPRVENYVKNRRALRHLLQVPMVKDDGSRHKNGAGEEDAVSSEMLTDIIEESMQVFWEFLRADKDEANATSKTPQQARVAPHDPTDFELLMDVRTDLQKREKRLKDIQRSTNCIIKKLQRQHHGNLLDHALFIAQVELKLVSRVLNMLKITTDQLVWCHEKLNRINFSSRKIELEPSFTLFPC
ncbi:uncharacterized protein LOC110428385 [Herrania umbratica]|uniref:Uncharacterized protein LOC110428385 n=1 Tax=Herrania umbratica TaxID=108875 RepID=A0A6J1BKU1_9ROSI|nr:uncharacterized protein LOC110428385 [Herrania umbratica]